MPNEAPRVAATMRRLIATILIGSLAVSVVVVGKPQQQQQQQRQDSQVDKQLLRKALGEESARAAAAAAANQPNSNSDNSNGPANRADPSSSSSTISFQCPEQFGYYTDTKDCTKYYVCVFGEVLHESCTGGLRFSRELQTCDWPRNVDCQQQATNDSSASAPTTSSNQATSPTPLSTSPSSGASTTNSNNNNAATTTAASSPTTGGTLSAATLPQHNNNNENNQERAMKPSMVFADEGSDPQQPSFDEAISPVITADGAIHLHDGSGGTFSLTPNHNRALQNSSPQSAGDLNQNLNQQQPAGNQNVDVFVKPLTNKPLASRQQQFQATSGQIANQNSRQQQSAARQQQQPRLQAVALPNQNNPNLQLENSNEMSDLSAREQPVSYSDDPEGANSDGGDAGDPANDGGANGDFSQPPGEPIGTQADQESNENGQPNLSEPNFNGNDFANNNDDQSDEQGANVGPYIPPVLASSNGNVQPPRQRLQPAPNDNNQLRQSSQLISINNRQIVDPTRQTFKPILIDPPQPNPIQLISSSNQRHQDNSRLSDFTHRQNNFQHFVNSSTSSNSNSRNLILNNAQPQTNRQSRQQSGQLGAPTNQLAGRTPANQFFNFNNQNSNGNNNFNDTSKLIRLQASQNSNQLLDAPQSPLVGGNTFKPRFPTPGGASAASSSGSRSQQSSGPFAQQPPFAFAGGAGEPNNKNNNLNVPHDQFNHHHQAQLSPAQLPGGRSANNGPPPGQAASSSLALQQQQQQRRPRPPKRHQIPSGGGSQNGQQQQQSGGGNNNNNLSSRRPNQLINNFDQPTTPSSTRSSLGANNALPIGANFNILPAGRVQDDHSTTSLVEPVGAFPGTPPTRSQRPIVAPTTVNFQARDQQPAQQQFGGTTPSIGSPLTTTTLRQQRPSGGQEQKQQVNQPISRARAGSQGQASARLQGAVSSTFAPPGSLQSGGDSLDGQPLLSLAKSGGGSSGGSSTQSASTAPSSSIDQPTSTATATTTSDPQQLAANRYLNSAIDALEAGQPFGTVDYDFDILNDNSTERRNLSGGSGGANQTAAPFNGPANRQRQSASGEQDDEGISLTNGQPSSGGGADDDDGAGGSANNLRQASGRARLTNNKQADLSPASFGGGAAVHSQHGHQHPQPPAAAAAAPTKKPRPTNKKIQVNHEQALANNRASIEPAKRPEALFQTPAALQTATKCDTRLCRLPDCKCGDTLVPANLDPKVIPQIVLLTFDDAVNDLNWEIYEELFSGRTNPNGCPLLATFYVSHEWTDYGQVQTLYSRGHEMASHSITHSFGEKFSKSQWFKEVNGQREILNMYGGVKMNDVRGMRAPFLQIGGNKMFEMLYDANFTYDSSMPIFENSPPLWPYTLDYQLAHECMITPCPTKSFPGVWEVGMTMWVDLRGGRCSMGDACSNPSDEDGVYEMLMKNFNRHYKSNRAPFGLFYHSAWFNTVHHRRGFLRFMATVNALPEVFFVTNWQMLQWMRQPTPMSEINSFEPWQCPAKTDRPPPCYHPSVCNVKSEHGTRFMKTCQPCPANQQYPWVGSTGFKGKQTASGSG